MRRPRFFKNCRATEKKKKKEIATFNKLSTYKDPLGFTNYCAVDLQSIFTSDGPNTTPLYMFHPFRHQLKIKHIFSSREYVRRNYFLFVLSNFVLNHVFPIHSICVENWYVCVFITYDCSKYCTSIIRCVVYPSIYITDKCWLVDWLVGWLVGDHFLKSLFAVYVLL
jgi:hypothetical protein